MKSNQLSRAPASTGTFDERLRDVFTLDEATPVLDEYLSSIQIDDENPGFLFDWDMNNLIAFVEAANCVATPAPAWLQTRPRNITVNSFTDDLMRELHQVAGGRYGHVLLAPNDPAQFHIIGWTLAVMCNGEFLQAAADAAFGDDERPLATTFYLTDTNAQRAVPINLPPPRRDDQVLRRLFI